MVTSRLTPIAEKVACAIEAYGQTCSKDDPLYNAKAKVYMFGCVSLVGPNVPDAPLKVDVTQMERYYAGNIDPASPQ